MAANAARTRARHVLDVRIGSPAHPFGTLSLLRDGGPGFNQDDEEDLGRVAYYFAYALRHAANACAGLSSVIEDEAMLLAMTSGDILFLSDSADALLGQLALQEPQLFDRRTLPPFCLPARTMRCTAARSASS